MTGKVWINDQQHFGKTSLNAWELTIAAASLPKNGSKTTAAAR